MPELTTEEITLALSIDHLNIEEIKIFTLQNNHLPQKQLLPQLLLERYVRGENNLQDFTSNKNLMDYIDKYLKDYTGIDANTIFFKHANTEINIRKILCTFVTQNNKGNNRAIGPSIYAKLLMEDKETVICTFKALFCINDANATSLDDIMPNKDIVTLTKGFNQYRILDENFDIEDSKIDTLYSDIQDKFKSLNRYILQNKINIYNWDNTQLESLKDLFGSIFNQVKQGFNLNPKLLLLITGNFVRNYKINYPLDTNDLVNHRTSEAIHSILYSRFYTSIEGFPGLAESFFKSLILDDPNKYWSLPNNFITDDKEALQIICAKLTNTIDTKKIIDHMRQRYDLIGNQSPIQLFLNSKDLFVGILMELIKKDPPQALQMIKEIPLLEEEDIEKIVDKLIKNADPKHIIHLKSFLSKDLCNKIIDSNLKSVAGVEGLGIAIESFEETKRPKIILAFLTLIESLSNNQNEQKIEKRYNDLLSICHDVNKKKEYYNAISVFSDSPNKEKINDYVKNLFLVYEVESELPHAIMSHAITRCSEPPIKRGTSSALTLMKSITQNTATLSGILEEVIIIANNLSLQEKDVMNLFYHIKENIITEESSESSLATYLNYFSRTKGSNIVEFEKFAKKNFLPDLIHKSYCDYNVPKNSPAQTNELFKIKSSSGHHLI
jgi:hypothetical protein